MNQSVRMLYKISVETISLVTSFQHEILYQNRQFSTCLLIFTFAEQNLLQNAFSQVPNMNNIIPDTDPLFEEKGSLQQCMSLCVTLLPCLSVFVAKRGSCRGYQLSHRHLNGVGFLSAEGETYYYKGELFGKNDFHLTLIDNLKSHFYYWSII